MEETISFVEWIKSQVCNECGEQLELNFYNLGRTIHKIRDVDFEKVKGFYCNKCYEKAIITLKNKRFVKRYRGQEIYYKDGRYSLWQSIFYFKTLEDLQKWIDIRLKSINEGLIK